MSDLDSSAPAGHQAPPPPTSPADQPRPDFSAQKRAIPQSQLPASPPLSTSASQIDPTAAPSPQAFTPVSAPMSAVQSQQGSSIAEGDEMQRDIPAEQRVQKHPHSDDESTAEPNKRRRTTPMGELPSTGEALNIPINNETKADVLQEQRPPKHKLSEEEEHNLVNESSKRRRTDHDREENPPDVVDNPNTNSTEYSPLYKLCSRRRSPVQDITSSLKDLSVQNQESLTDENLTAISMSRPHSSQNLLSLYGLDDIAASVARRDPVTGEKINKLRKSYEGKVKDLPGKNRAANRPGELMNLLRYPDEEWHIQYVQGNELTGEISDALQAKIEKAVIMEPGKLPDGENERLRNLLGLDDPNAKTSIAPTPTQTKVENTQRKSRPSRPNSPPNGSSFEPPRPKRTGTKRRYNDDSFEGYGEGYADDGGDHIAVVDDVDEDELAADTGNNKRKKRRVGRPRKWSPRR